MSPRVCLAVVAALGLVASPGAAAGGKPGPVHQQGGRKLKRLAGKPAHRAPNSLGANHRPRRASPQRSRPAASVASPGAVRARSADDLVYGEPIRFHNLSLVPVGTTRKGPFTRYTLLEQGLAHKTLQVRELNGKSSQARVNAVEVRNKGRRPVYLLGGEMILGGKQDRIIQHDTVLPPRSTWTRVKVFCVERRRWRGQNMTFRAGKAMAHLALRKAAIGGSQGAVWAEVARKNLKHGTQSSTGTYRRTIQNAKVRRKIAPYRRAILKRLPSGMKVAGMVFAINGRIRVADLFGNPVLFADLKDKLLSAYILEALGQQVVKNAAPVSKKAAKSYLRRARKAKREKLGNQGQSVNYRKRTDKTVGTETVDQKSGKVLRETYLAD